MGTRVSARDYRPDEAPLWAPQTYQALYAAASRAIDWAIAPSSQFRVGAALGTATKRVYTGCNIESPVYLGMCAERVALFKGLSEGERDFEVLAIVSEQGLPCLPCGTCRQLLAEFAPNLQIVVFDCQASPQTYNLEELLPQPFTRKGRGPFRAS